MVSEVSVANKEEIDAGKKVEESEVSKKELVGQAAPLVDVSGKNSNGKVSLFLLVSYNGCHCFCKAKDNMSFHVICLTLFLLFVLSTTLCCQFGLILLIWR